jgi:hypothetical protein
MHISSHDAKDIQPLNLTDNSLQLFLEFDRHRITKKHYAISHSKTKPGSPDDPYVREVTDTAVSNCGFTLAYNCNKVLLGPSFVSSLALSV